MGMLESTGQDSINEAEWADPDNWCCGIYFSKRDTRAIVPKRPRRMGWTVNVGRPAGALTFIGVLMGLPLVALLLVVLKCSR